MQSDQKIRGSQKSDDDPKASATIVASILGALLIFVIIIVLQAFFYHSEESERAFKLYNQVPQELATLKAQQQEDLNRYCWIDQAHGVVGIPIDRAMELVVQEAARRVR